MRARIALLTVLCLPLMVGCESKNKDIIVGRWKATKLPGVPSSQMDQVYSILEFFEDGTMSWWIQTDMGSVSLDGTYHLGWGERVTFRLSKPLQGRKVHAETIKIEGDTLEMIDSDGTTGTFERQ